ncbi:hypothetical protein [Marinimicrobium sp. ABcell2]|uniref:hypothetical protein n=1 Tax=Marinimicrobium sp. ABcell2 TaxID=3069751 RepID=UPI0027B3939F|nr:hypothetical protein [Marinimicrobium sp. ABcell2]MDQ2077978.1 hypothetical protein [Marinimicrobium sp. ABcell2]
MIRLNINILLRLLVATLLLAVAAALSGCGGSSGGDDPGTGGNGDGSGSGNGNGNGSDDDDDVVELEFSVGGSLSGLAQGSVELILNDDEILALSEDGSFSFDTQIDDGNSFAVAVNSQPDGQYCALENESGTVESADADNILVTCSDLSVTQGRAEPRNQAVLVSWNSVDSTDYNLVWSTDPEMDPENYSAYEGSGAANDIGSPFLVEGLTNDQQYYFALESGGAGFGPLFGTRPMAPVSDMSARALMFDSDDNLFFGGSMTGAARMSGGFVALDRETLTPLPTAMVAGRVNDMVEDGNGGYFLGGQFKYIDGEPQKFLARIDENGQLDTDWQVDVDGYAVFGLLRDGDRLYVRGGVNGLNGVSVDGAAKLNLQGDVLAWDLEHVIWINHWALHEGELYIAGRLEITEGQEERGVARFDENGKFLNWIARFDEDGQVFSMSIDEAGAVYMAGSFNEVNGESRDGFARADANGDLSDLTLDHGFLRPNSMLVTDDRIYVGEGHNPNPSEYLKAFERETGEVLAWPESQPGYGNLGWTTIVHSIHKVDGRILVGGQFAFVGSEFRNGSALFSEDGALLDGPDYRLPRGGQSVIPEEDRLLFGLTYPVWDRQDPWSFGVVDSEGQFRDWGLGVSGTVEAFAEAHDHIYVGFRGQRTGESIRVDGVARFDPDTGEFDLSWQPDLEVSDTSPLDFTVVYALHRLGDALIVRGSFQSVNGSDRAGFAALDSTATLLPHFPEPQNGGIRSMSGTDEVLYMGGDFDGFGEESRDYLAAVDADGNVTDWAPTLDGSVRYVDYHNGIVYVAGDFENANETPRNGFAAFDTNGDLQPWNPGLEKGDAGQMLSATSMGVFVSGSFDEVDGVPRNGYALLDGVSGNLIPEFVIDDHENNGLLYLRSAEERSDGVVCFGTGNRNGRLRYYEGQGRNGMFCIDQDMSLYW